MPTMVIVPRTTGSTAMPSPRSFHRFCLAALLALGVLASPPAAAQSDWLGSAKKMLEGLSGGGGLSRQDMVAGLKEALRLATERAVDEVGHVGGFSDDPAIHIPLPDQLRRMHEALSRIGLGSMTADLETRLNRAAETAAPEAQAVFWQAVDDMSFEDAKRILNGPEDAATQYFRERMSTPLAERFRPIVEESLVEAGAVRAYEDAVGRYARLPLVPDVKADLAGYVVDRGLDGIFHHVAKQEAAIRADPAARTTELLQRVFGG